MSKHSTISDIELVSLEEHESSSGTLFVAQIEQHVPFKVERSFIVKSSQAITKRGNHAHRTSNQFMICIEGEIEIKANDGKVEDKYIMKGAQQGLFIPAGIWSEQIYKTESAVLLVLCDSLYDESEYIRNHDEFLSYKTQEIHKIKNEMIRLNLGCGGRPLQGYVNIDMDTLEQIKKRYPNQEFDDDLIVVQYDLFDLPYQKNSVDEIRSEGLIEHLSFIDEPKFFNEVVRVLKPNGKLFLSTVDFERTAKQWLDAKDDWKDFYRDDKDAILNEHWFGTYTYEPINRWGYLTATLFGSQNGTGQFHTNCYTEAKLHAICKKMNLHVDSIEHFQWKGDRDHMLKLTATKKEPS